MNYLTITAFFFLSLILTGLIRRYALVKQIIDIPCHRSSHTQPTPRGGGLGFVLCFLLVLIYLMLTHQLTWSLGMSLAVSGFLVSALGFWDDRNVLPAIWRLAGHFSAAGLVLFALRGMPPLIVLGWTVSAGWVLSMLIVLYLVWMLNLYNFMDGIDGIAGVEAVSVCSGISLIYQMAGVAELAVMPLFLASAVAGFLVWNIPQARIFMGDAGSGFLGFAIAVMSIAAAHWNPDFFWAWLILLAVFIVDATVTLFCRALAGKNLSEAHRSHAYQCAARLCGSHLKVTMAVVAINVFWLFPWACIAVFTSVSGSVALFIVCVPLVVGTLWLKASDNEDTSAPDIDCRRR